MRTFVSALGHPPPPQRDPLHGAGSCVHRPVVPSVHCHRVVHLRFDEKLQNVRVFLVLARLVVSAVAGVNRRVRTEHKVAVEEPAVHRLLHHVEPGPGFDHSCDVLPLVRLLQVLGRTRHKIL